MADQTTTSPKGVRKAIRAGPDVKPDVGHRSRSSKAVPSRTISNEDGHRPRSRDETRLRATRRKTIGRPTATTNQEDSLREAATTRPDIQSDSRIVGIAGRRGRGAAGAAFLFVGRPKRFRLEIPVPCYWTILGRRPGFMTLSQRK